MIAKREAVLAVINTTFALNYYCGGNSSPVSWQVQNHPLGSEHGLSQNPVPNRLYFKASLQKFEREPNPVLYCVVNVLVGPLNNF